MLPHDIYLYEVRQQFLRDAEQHRLAREVRGDAPALHTRLAQWAHARLSAANPPHVQPAPRPAARPTTLSARIR